MNLFLALKEEMSHQALAWWLSIRSSHPRAPETFSAVDRPTAITSTSAAYTLPSVRSVCASVFHEIAWLNLQARGCVCVRVFVSVCLC